MARDSSAHQRGGVRAAAVLAAAPHDARLAAAAPASPTAAAATARFCKRFKERVMLASVSTIQ